MRRGFARRLLAWAVIVAAAWPAARGADARPAPTTATIEVVHEKKGRGLPPTATQLRLTGLAADNQTVLFGPVNGPAKDRVKVDAVPVTVQIVQIAYLDGTTLVARFEGFVKLAPGKTTEVVNPPWVTQPPCNGPPAADELGRFGARLDVSAIVPIALLPQALPGPLFPNGSALPSTVTLDNLPPVGMQGTIPALGYPGSCIAWSFGYGLGSYTAARNLDGSVRWDASDPRNQPSPAFLYPLVHQLEGENPPASCPQGSYDLYLPQLVWQGAPSVAQVPYAPDCCYLNGMNLTKRFPHEDRLRIGSYAQILLPGRLGPDASAYLTRIKQFLAAGMAVAFAGPVFDSFTTLPLDGGVFYPTGSCAPDPGCGHGMLLVGYNDGIGDPSLGLGAFLVQNSFGTNWPPGPSPAPPGMFYLSYNGFLDSQLTAHVAYPLDPARPKGRPLAATPRGAPHGYVTAAYQWEHQVLGSVETYLVLQHWFSEPVQLQTVAIAEPSPSTATATQTNGYALANGYTYFRRADGNSFLTGAYQITITALDAAGRPFTYMGTATVGPPPASQPQLPAATMPGTVYGSTGSAVPVER
jgi:hypothetical protein